MVGGVVDWIVVDEWLGREGIGPMCYNRLHN